MLGSPFRAVRRLAGYLALTLAVMPVQVLALAFGSRWAGVLPAVYHRLCCRLLGVRVEARGEISTARPTLFVVNHISYTDIMVLSSLIEVSFVAKREIASWPLFGLLARLQRTVFVARRRSGVAGERDDLARALAEGRNLVLFAEGTSGDGNRVLPFKSALFSVAEREVDGRRLAVQPVTLAYTRLDGMPIGRLWRPYFAWTGTASMLPHLWRAVGLGRVTVSVEFHPTVVLSEFGSRKALAGHCERIVGRGLAAANAGRLAASPSRLP
ncbi:MAG: lysophospholipid acyltransferase family protein [Pseudomonadota bacterium]